MAEKEYIERGALVEFLEQEIKQCEADFVESCGDDRYEQAVDSRMTAFLEVYRRVVNKPAADVIEVRHAYWKETRHITISKRGREIHSKLYNCSYCDAPNGRKKSSYCHWCGAKMDGERKEQK